MPVNDIIACSVAAERAGFGIVSVGESFFRDGFALASAIASHTRKVQLGTSIMPIYTRSPFQLAMGAATLNELSMGRVDFLGLGIGYKARTEQYFGIRQTQRLERMKEYVEIIRNLLSGEETSYHGKLFDLDKFPRLSNRPQNIPVYFGSSAPKMLALAGKTADGVILNSISTPEYVNFARETIISAAKQEGRDPSRIEIGHSVIYAVCDDGQKAIDAAKEDILFYCSYPEIDPVIEKSQFKNEVSKIRELYSKGDKKVALSYITDEMLDTFAVYGSPKECRIKLQKFVRRGVTLPIIRTSVGSYPEHEQKQVFLRTINSLDHWKPK